MEASPSRPDSRRHGNNIARQPRHDHNRSDGEANALTFVVGPIPATVGRRDQRAWQSCHSLAFSMLPGNVGGVVPLLSEGILRTQARALIEEGKLPVQTPVRMWGGAGAGSSCSVCGMFINEDDKELEIQVEQQDVAPGLDRFHFHIRCFAAWELERPSHG